MSMLSEQVNQLKEEAKWLEKDQEKRLASILYQASDTIEALSAKLAAANMERSDRYYGGGWIYCGDGNNLPQPGKRYRVTALWKDGDFETRSVYDLVYGTDGLWHGENYVPVSFEIIAWKPLDEPYKENLSEQTRKTILGVERAVAEGCYYENLKNAGISSESVDCEFNENQMSDRAWANYRKEQRKTKWARRK